jgi:hypothetical protein
MFISAAGVQSTQVALAAVLCSERLGQRLAINRLHIMLYCSQGQQQLREDDAVQLQELHAAEQQQQQQQKEEDGLQQEGAEQQQPATAELAAQQHLAPAATADAASL